MMHAPRQSEADMCAGFVKALDGLLLHGQIVNADSFLYLHIPNGQRAGNNQTARAIAGAFDKRLGAKRGAPDYLLLWRDIEGVPFIGFLEAKSAVGQLSKEQEEFRAYCLREAIPFAVFRTVQEGLSILQSWGVIKEGVVL